MNKMILFGSAATVVLIAVIAVFLIPGTICMPTGISEKYWNGIDDNCNGQIDEEYVSTVCGNGIVEFGEFCDDGNTKNLDGCSSDCKVETEDTIYVAPYVGNIDGDYSPEWYPIYDRLADFFTKNEIHAGFSIYPISIHGGEFGRRFEKIYNSQYIEFIQKGNLGDNNETETIMYKLSFKEVSDIIEAGRDNFKKGASQIMGTSDIKTPVAYNQPQGMFSQTMRDVLSYLGFHIFFEMYMNDDLGPVNSTDTFDVMQYGVAVTTTGEAGMDTYFRHPDEMISALKNFYREDLYMLYINNKKVVPIWVHQQDFESKTQPDTIDEGKWRTYTTTLIKLKEDPNVVLISPSQIWEMRHPNLAS